MGRLAVALPRGPQGGGLNGFLQRRWVAVTTVLRTFGLAVLPLVAITAMMTVAVDRHVFALDFSRAFGPAARDVLHGHSPYVAANDPALHAGAAFVYPAAAAVLMTPLALLPHTVGGIVMTILVGLSAFATLWVLGVRDWRCYGAMALSFPFFNGLQSANVSLPLAFGVALAWRYRDKRIVVASVVALAVSMKLFVWPLFVWLLVTRWRTALAAGVAAGAVSLGSWAIVGFGEIPRFLRDLSTVNHVEQSMAYTPFAFFSRLGVPDAGAHALMWLIGFAVLAAVVVVAQRPNGDRLAFTLALAASLLLSPIVWGHYFALLWVPLALARPRFALVWLIPIALWFCPQPPSHPVAWQLALGLGALTALVYVSISSRPARSRRRLQLRLAPASASSPS
jgi:hypothetical protein